MAMLKHLNEFGREAAVMALEPARDCVSHCTYCFAQLSASVQAGDNKKNHDDTSTFESYITKSFSDSYDPTHFIQYLVHNRYPVCYANTVEPFQDAEQATAILRQLDRHGIPVWFQTKSYNMDKVWDVFKRFHDNSSVLLSFPTQNQAIIKRFEPGTPPVSDRIAACDRMAEAGFQITLGLSPYHEDWCDDLAGHVSSMIDRGVSRVFFDRLHLNRRQVSAARDKAMVALATDDGGKVWTDKMLGQYTDMYNMLLERDVPVYSSGNMATLFGLNRTAPCIIPEGVFKRGNAFQYHDGDMLLFLESVFLDDEDFDISNINLDHSLVVTYADVRRMMERDGSIDQPFRFSGLRDLMDVKNLPPTWRQALSPSATVSEYFRALWNNPGEGSFAWRHPWSRLLTRPDGSPWLDDEGNLLMIFDPGYVENHKTRRRPEPEISHFRRLETS